MRLPVFITLTVDRTRFAGPEAAYEAGMAKVSQLLSVKIGGQLWGRVCEVQDDSGDGWAHWHVTIDVAGTRFDQSTSKRKWVDLAALRAEVMKWWVDRWRLGGTGGQDIQLVKKPQGVASYHSKYITKGWPAIPEWVLHRKLFRSVGFSKAANEHFRRSGLAKVRLAAATEPESKSKRQQQRSTVLERLASSGHTCKVVVKGIGWIGKVGCRLNDLLIGSVAPISGGGHGALIELVSRSFQNFGGVVQRGMVVLRGAWRDGIERINRWAERAGIVQKCQDEYRRRVDYWLNSWWLHRDYGF
jgi:hypothetical protein